MKRVFRKVGIFALLTLFLASQPLETHAFDYYFYSTNNIEMYNDSATECVGGELILSGRDNRQKIYNFLIDKGLNSQQAAGVLGNIQRESGYSPTRHEQSHANFANGGYGLAQWTGGRRDALAAYLTSNQPELMTNYYNDAYGGAVSEGDGFIPKNSATGELMPIADNDAFLMAELNFLFDETSARRITASTASQTSAKQGENEWEALKKATGVEDATKIWLYNFEIPANIAQAAIDRTASAQELLAILQSESAGGNSQACLDTSSGDVAALQGTVMKYAWPDYRGRDVNMKPEYKEAVDQALAKGEYVGGIRYRGVDCGGFVTLVMRNSGYEPNYNAAKMATSGQKIWLEANWENLGNGSSIDTASLKPGDVAMQEGHTFMFAGTNMESFGATTSGWRGVASASLDERAPMAGLESLTSSEVTWYRKKVVSHE